jgi:hypothetical protein
METFDRYLCIFFDKGPFNCWELGAYNTIKGKLDIIKDIHNGKIE